MAQVEIAELQKKEKEKFLNEKEKKIEKEISKIQSRHNNETQAMELKIANHKNSAETFIKWSKNITSINVNAIKETINEKIYNKSLAWKFRMIKKRKKKKIK